MKEKVKPIQLRMVKCEKPIPIPISSKETLKQVVTDFIIHDMSGGMNSYIRKNKNRKYDPINVYLYINGHKQNLTLQLPIILAKYSSLAKCQVQNGIGIQQLSADILDFIEKIQDESNSLSITVHGDITIEKVVNALAQRHFRQKKRQLLQDEYNIVKINLTTKYKKVNFTGINQRQMEDYDTGERNEQNSQRVNRSTVSALMQKQQSGKKHLQIPTKSRLKALVDSCNVFHFADRVEALKRQKLIAQFCDGKQADYIGIRQQVKKNYPFNSSSTLTVETMEQLQEWINDISVSQALFKRKYEPDVQKKQNKNKKQDSSSADEEQR